MWSRFHQAKKNSCEDILKKGVVRLVAEKYRKRSGYLR